MVGLGRVGATDARARLCSPTIDVLGIRIAKSVLSAPGSSGQFDPEPTRLEGDFTVSLPLGTLCRFGPHLVWSDFAVSFGRVYGTGSLVFVFSDETQIANNDVDYPIP